MAGFLYNCLLIPLLLLTSPVWGLALWRVPKMRAGFWHKLGFYPPSVWQRVAALPKGRRVWVHAVSVGELNAARGLIQTFLNQGDTPVLTTTTLTGYTMAQAQWPQLVVLYCPFDVPWAVACVTRHIAPVCVVILETELWPNLLMHLKSKGIPTFLVNARLSEKSFRGYARVRGLMRPLLACLTGIFAQSDADKARFEALGAQSVQMLGNLKFETPPPIQKLPNEPNFRPEWLAYCENRPLLVIASTHPAEEALLVPLIKALQTQFPELAVVLAPRHPERVDSVCAILADTGLSVLRRSAWRAGSEAPISTIRVLDTVGELQGVFACATVTLMGGTFVPWGGHNILEPLQAGCPVVFGPSMHNFKAVMDAVLSEHAGIQVQTVAEAQRVLGQLLQDTNLRLDLQVSAQRLLGQHQGVTQRLVDAVSRGFTS